MSIAVPMSVTVPVDLFHRLVTAATLDPKTGALTWAAWNARARSLLDDADRHRDWALLIVDFDRFAHLNSTHGHIVADHVLRAAVAALLRIVGTDGAVGRWGGDEFVLLAPTRSLLGALRRADDIRRAVSELEVAVDGPHGALTVTGITASVGVTIVESADLVTGLWTADAALYAAKRSGGNTVRNA